jgi:hypothetical protein
MQLGMFIIERHQIGEPDETVFLPICDGCGEPITDFNMGNLIVVDPEPPAEKTKQPKRKLDGRPLVQWTCADMHFFHSNYQCDFTAGKGNCITWWSRLSSLIRKDQRGPVDRVMAGLPAHVEENDQR